MREDDSGDTDLSRFCDIEDIRNLIELMTLQGCVPYLGRRRLMMLALK